MRASSVFILGAAACAALLAPASGCLQYNEPCGGLVENPEQLAGHTDGDVYLDRNNARHANHAIARLAARAFIDAFPAGDVELGVMNGGAIRSEGGVEGPDGRCLTRNTLKAGAVTLGDIHQILLFENLVYAANVPDPVLYEVFEHSVSGLLAKPDGQLNPAIASPSGRFLQVSGAGGVEVRVDCSLPPGERITGLRVGDREVQRDGDGVVRVAMPEFILRGGDGYGMLAPLASDVATVVAEKEGGIDNDITAAYFSEHHATPETALAVFPEDRIRCTLPEATVANCQGETCCQSPLKLVNCAYPLPPEEQ